MSPRQAGLANGLLLVFLVSLAILPQTALAKSKPAPPIDGSIAISNGIINIDIFGETESGYDVWLYPNGFPNAYHEAPLISYGSNLPVYLSAGSVITPYPDTGVPGTWYEATIELDLDGDASGDVRVVRSIMVPSARKCFYVWYAIVNTKGIELPRLRLFQGVDYDVSWGVGDEAGYAPGGVVWAHDLDDGTGVYVGFKGDKKPSHHSVASWEQMWNQLETSSLNDADYYQGDVGVALEWDLGTLGARGLAELGVTFCFADSGTELGWLLGTMIGVGISADYKRELLGAADDLLDLAHDLLRDVRESIFTSLVKVKDWKVEAQATLETCLKYEPVAGYVDCAARAADLIQSADDEKTQTTFKGLKTVHDSLMEMEAEVTDLILDIEQATLDGEIAQGSAEALIKRTVTDEQGLERPYAPLLVLMVFLSDKNIYLVEMDKLLEMANEYESEALARLNIVATTCATSIDCQEKAVKEALKALKQSIKLIREAEKYLWLIKDNIKTIKAWLCGFQQLVIRAPTLAVEEAPSSPTCPWCLPPASALGTLELRAYAENGTIRFAALGSTVEGLRVQVFNLAGRQVFDSGMVPGSQLSWGTHAVANGVYLYVIAVRARDGTILRSEVKKLVILH